MGVSIQPRLVSTITNAIGYEVYGRDGRKIGTTAHDGGFIGTVWADRDEQDRANAAAHRVADELAELIDPEGPNATIAFQEVGDGTHRLVITLGPLLLTKTFDEGELGLLTSMGVTMPSVDTAPPGDYPPRPTDPTQLVTWALRCAAIGRRLYGQQEGPWRQELLAFGQSYENAAVLSEGELDVDDFLRATTPSWDWRKLGVQLDP